MPRPLFFDLDGTLTDPGEGITRCVEHALLAMERDCPPRKQLSNCVGPPLAASFARLLATEDKAEIDRAIALYRERYIAEGMLENVIYPGTLPLLTSLREAGHTMFVVTSKPAHFASQIVDHFELREFFRAVHGSDMDGTRAGKPELIAHVLRVEGLDESRPWMIGDRSYDMIGARANGLDCVGVTWGYGSRQELEEACATAVIDSSDELLRGLLS